MALLALLNLDRAAAATPAVQQRPPAARVPESVPPRPAGSPNSEPDQTSRNVVARARMLECGHQWSNLKRAGTASGTWKDFSRGCLAQR